MKIYKETSLDNFEFWAGAKDFVNELSHEDLVDLESCLEDLYPDGIDETQLNDIFWFDKDWVCEMLGFEDYESWVRRNDEENEDESEEDEE